VAGVKAMPTPVPACPVALKVTDPIAAALATTLFVPAIVPRVKPVEALPVLSVTALLALSEPLPRVSEKVTATPGMPLPRLRTLTMSGLPRAVPTTPVWLFPLTILN